MMKLGFALEYSLGHTTHAQNLKRVLTARPDVAPTYVDLPYEGVTGGVLSGSWARLPGVRSNWSLHLPASPGDRSDSIDPQSFV